ncbi:MAG: complex I NDUFA9 subunit family protein [Hyphomicrobiaceae bacterium]|nr:complex I NDUFA9 subunit family protein [Hyphomicrobiaceae bacterium]
MGIRLDSSRLVTVYGGSGFLGRHVVQALARTGCRIRVAVRRPDLAGFLQPLGGVGQIHAVQANLRFPESVAQAAEDADVLVNLVGILHETGKQKFSSVQAEGPRWVAHAARDAGAKALIQVSAIGADRNSPSHYAQSKAAGEAHVLNSFPDAVILRPSIVFGPEDDFFNRFAALARIAPALPLIGGGKTRFQPVFAGDVAKAVVAAIEGRGAEGKTYELGGPEILTFKEVLQRILEYCGRRRLLVPMPFWMAYAKAAFLQLLPSPLLTVDQVRLLESDNVVSVNAKTTRRTLEALGVDPLPVSAIVPDYLERFRSRGEFAAFRRENG